jgi:hypothetical protein
MINNIIVININVDKALIFGLIPLLAIEKIVIDKFVTPLPVVSN